MKSILKIKKKKKTLSSINRLAPDPNTGGYIAKFV